MVRRIRNTGIACLVVLALCLLDSVTGTATFNLRQRGDSNVNVNLNAPPFDEFPALNDVTEMANLSHSVYQYRKFQDLDNVCDDWNNKTTTSLTHSRGVTCHWYLHDEALGTQVMIVSSSEQNYLAVVFAGTDDLLTTLLDVDIRKVDFGTKVFDDQDLDQANASRIPVSLDCADCKVHEGFNNAVFSNNIFDEIYIRVEALRPQFTRLFTTGHSLGAANSILTALGLALEFEKKNIDMPHPVTSLNFGCPQVGNVEFQQYIHSHFLSHSNTTRSSRYLSIWRFVLGWDLVPRLPEFFEHIGHTVQMHHDECKEIIHCHSYDKWLHPSSHHDNITKEALTYYHHLGNETLHYAGVPTGWSEKPYLWVPGALMSHAISRYAAFFDEWQMLSAKTWIHDFVGEAPSSNSSSDALIDDDTYAEPPDYDPAYMYMALRQDEGVWERVQRQLRTWVSWR